MERSDRSPDHADGSAANAVAAAATRAKKPAWSKPSAAGAADVGGPVMGGAVAWPALSESARASPKSTAADPLPDCLSPVAPISSPVKQASSGNQNPNSGKIHQPPGRQKSMKRGGGDGVSSSSGALANGTALPSSEAQPAAEVASSEPVNKGNNSGEHGFRGGEPDHHREYGGGRRGNNGGNGPHRGGFGHRRDQDWGHRSFNGRDSHMQLGHQPRGGGPRPQPRPVPAVAPTFIGPPSLQGQPFVSPMGFPDMNSALYPMVAPPPPETYGGVPLIAHPMAPAMYFPAVDSSHRTALLKQIEYYFSTENLCKDIYLRQNMDDQGWVPISLISGFNKVKLLTNNLHYILDTVQYSTVLEVQGDRIRKRNEWMNWLLPQPNRRGTSSGPQSPVTPNYENLAVHLQGVNIEDQVINNSRTSLADTSLTRSSSGNLNDQSQVIGDCFVDGDLQISGYAHSDQYFMSTRSLSRSDTL